MTVYTQLGLKIIYRIIEDKVYITDIFDTRRNPDKIMP